VQQRKPPSARIVLVAAIALAWAVSVPLMWHAVTTVPSAARLQAMSARVLHVPTPETFLRMTGRSLLELVVLGALLWPWWRRFWLVRLLLALLALAVYAVATVPLELTTLAQVHHQWLAAADVLLLIGVLATAAARLARALRRTDGGAEA
jgi:hypothetical protein